MLAALDAHPREHARERQDPGRQADAADRARRPRSVPRREVDRLGRRRVARRRAARPASAAGRCRARRQNAPSSMRVWNASSSATISSTRSSELSPSSSSVVVRRRDRRGRRTSRRSAASASAPACDERGARAARHPVADRRALQLARAFGARQLRLRPDQRAPDLLVIVELRVRLRARPRRHRCPARARAPRARALPIRSARRRPPNRARRADRVQHALDVLGKDVQPFGRDDHFLLAPADVQLAVGADLADVAGVEPAVLERARGFLVGVEVAASSRSRRARGSRRRRAIFTSTPAIALPTDPFFVPNGWFSVTIGAVSVRP